MERDKRDGVAVFPSSGGARRSVARLVSFEERPHAGTVRSALPAKNEIWDRIGGDITAFLAAMDSVATDDSDSNCEALLAATDRLLWASARTRLELERLLNDRNKRATLRPASG